MGDFEFSIGLPPGMVASTLSTVHGSGIFGVITMEGSSAKLLSVGNQSTGVSLVGVQTRPLDRISSKRIAVYCARRHVTDIDFGYSKLMLPTIGKYSDRRFVSGQPTAKAGKYLLKPISPTLGVLQGYPS